MLGEINASPTPLNAAEATPDLGLFVLLIAPLFVQFVGGNVVDSNPSEICIAK